MLLLCGCSRKGSETVLRPIADTGNDAAAEESSAGASEEHAEAENAEKAKDSGAEKSAVHATVYVYVCGAVRTEGVYELPEGSRVFDAVDAAGGFSSDADTSYVNQAAQVTDGVQIRIPEKTETAQNKAVPRQTMTTGITPDAGSTQGQSTLININTADEAGLCEIPGIGAGRAKDIISYRQEHGGFKKIEEIMQVGGIKEKLFNRIKDSITV
ncbi:MAG: helix-hairpin-helix domain-containing protein [Butyrivibrio sp.]|jgi:competence protein ComEA|nr:helix-hairpin-helix domain-containing protein [Butyrivibrio sp.]